MFATKSWSSHVFEHSLSMFASWKPNGITVNEPWWMPCGFRRIRTRDQVLLGVLAGEWVLDHLPQTFWKLISYSMWVKRLLHRGGVCVTWFSGWVCWCFLVTWVPADCLRYMINLIWLIQMLDSVRTKFFFGMSILMDPLRFLRKLKISFSIFKKLILNSRFLGFSHKQAKQKFCFFFVFCYFSDNF